ncbi:hypothetical protein ACFR9U_04045 [Halorientalis brevis]|uniref:Uncharacterized protein n=1 Tax=Halorientalis brevis TaxID=1126241 RepID=A0ABD6C7A3_9EURY|nr:hypothetical protein [Halorientalis brevis]
MSGETLETIRTVLESLLDETEDAEVHYKLRTALQLVEVQQSDLTQLEEVADEDSELWERLSELGYVE